MLCCTLGLTHRVWLPCIGPSPPRAPDSHGSHSVGGFIVECHHNQYCTHCDPERLCLPAAGWGMGKSRALTWNGEECACFKGLVILFDSCDTTKQGIFSKRYDNSCEIVRSRSGRPDSHARVLAQADLPKKLSSLAYWRK